MNKNPREDEIVDYACTLTVIERVCPPHPSENSACQNLDTAETQDDEVEDDEVEDDDADAIDPPSRAEGCACIITADTRRALIPLVLGALGFQASLQDDLCEFDQLTDETVIPTFDASEYDSTDGEFDVLDALALSSNLVIMAQHLPQLDSFVVFSNILEGRRHASHVLTNAEHKALGRTLLSCAGAKADEWAAAVLLGERAWEGTYLLQVASLVKKDPALLLDVILTNYVDWLAHVTKEFVPSTPEELETIVYSLRTQMDDFLLDDQEKGTADHAVTAWDNYWEFLAQ